MTWDELQVQIQDSERPLVTGKVATVEILNNSLKLKGKTKCECTQNVGNNPSLHRKVVLRSIPKLKVEAGWSVTLRITFNLFDLFVAKLPYCLISVMNLESIM